VVVRGHHIFSVAVFVAVFVGGCGGSGSGDTPSAASTAPPTTVAPAPSAPAAVSWSACGKLECGTLEVPLDHADPGGKKISLALARLPATGDRIGVLLTNPGGPGGSGIEFLQEAPFTPALREHFDIVAWDPRGVGQSAPIECDDRLDEYFATDPSPDGDAERQQLVDVTRAFVDSCARSGDLLPFVGTGATVQDMDLIRAALGEEQVNYLGFSYGTWLGALYAQRYPQRVRAMVLDGAVDPEVTPEDGLLAQTRGFEQALDKFVEWCRANPACGFARGGDPRAAIVALARSIEEETLPATVQGERRTLGPGEFTTALVTPLYVGEQAYPALAAALAAAARGDGSGLLTFADLYNGREPGGRYSNQRAAQVAIGCLDPAPRDPAELERITARATEVSPLFGPEIFGLSLPCAFWPVPPGPQTALRVAGAPTIVVVGTTGDPATPYVWAEGLTRQLGDATLLTLDGEGHTAYPQSACIQGVVDTYFTDLTVPAAGARCAD